MKLQVYIYKLKIAGASRDEAETTRTRNTGPRKNGKLAKNESIAVEVHAHDGEKIHATDFHRLTLRIALVTDTIAKPKNNQTSSRFSRMLPLLLLWWLCSTISC